MPQPQIGASEVGSELLSVDVTFEMADTVSANGSANALDGEGLTVTVTDSTSITSSVGILDGVGTNPSLQPNLGSSMIGTELLSVDLEITTIDSTSIEGTASTIEPFATTSASTTVTGVTGDVGALKPIVLDPENLQTYYDEQRGAFVSDWITETSPIPEDANKETVVVAELQSDDPITVILERDDTGDGTVDEQSLEHDIGYGLVEPLSIEAVEGSDYRLVFPEYSRDDDVDRLSIALSYANRDELEDAWPLYGIDLDSGPIGDLLDTFASELYRLDARIDEEYDNRFLETASGSILEAFGAPVDINRRAAEQDDQLRYRIAVEYAIRVSDGTLESLEAVCRKLFEDPSTLSLDIADGEPALDVTVPQSQINETPFDVATVEDKLTRTMASGYGVDVSTT